MKFIGFAGWSGSGKTTLLEPVIGLLEARRRAELTPDEALAQLAPARFEQSSRDRPIHSRPAAADSGKRTEISLYIHRIDQFRLHETLGVLAIDASAQE